ncbi:bestrophin-like domain [Segnochrobactrum spirostomi]|nr:hypothetical protein [Segnochrobactrum spirostomi]
MNTFLQGFFTPLEWVHDHFSAFGEALVVTAFVMLYAVVVFAVVLFVKARFPKAFIGISASILSPIGGIFGLSAAFLTADVWASNVDALRAVNDEARALSRMWSLAGGLTEPAKSEIRGDIVAYARIVETDEWPILATIHSPDYPIGQEARGRLYAIQTLTSRHSDNPDDQIILRNIYDLSGKAFDARTRRIVIAIDGSAYGKLYLAIGLGLVLIVGVAVTHSAHPIQTGFMTAATALVVVMVLGIVLGRPFDQGWSRIEPAKFFDVAGEVRGGEIPANVPPGSP